jgi:hypothetical protein
LARTYAPLLSPESGTAAFRLEVNAQRVQARRHCVWNPERSVDTPNGTVHAVERFDVALPPRRYCTSCIGVDAGGATSANIVRRVPAFVHLGANWRLRRDPKDGRPRAHGLSHVGALADYSRLHSEHRHQAFATIVKSLISHLLGIIARHSGLPPDGSDIKQET